MYFFSQLLTVFLFSSTEIIKKDFKLAVIITLTPIWGINSTHRNDHIIINNGRPLIEKSVLNQELNSLYANNGQVILVKTGDS